MMSSSQHDLSISDLFKGDFKLASPPNIYFELQKTIEDPYKSMLDAAFIIEKDAALAARLLQIVNSAFYGFPSKISSIDRAINLIGTKELQNIILSTVVMDKFSDLPGELISMHDFWANNIRCALIAQEIDQCLGKVFSDSIFICGILHNIGLLVFFRRIPELTKNTFLKLQAIEKPLFFEQIMIEKEVIGFDHFQTGSALMELWKLPNIICDSIRLHPYPDNTETNHQLASIIRLADYCSQLSIDYEDDIISNNLDLSPSKVRQCIENTSEKFEEIFNTFYQK